MTFNGFEIQRTDQGLLLGQNSYTKDLLARYNLEGFEETPAPVQLATVDFELKPEENAADHVRAAQCMAGELQWLASRCRPEILYAVNMIFSGHQQEPEGGRVPRRAPAKVPQTIPGGSHLLLERAAYDFGGPG